MTIDSGALLISVVVLLLVFAYGLRTSVVLRAQLKTALERQKSDTLELTERSALDTQKDEFVSTVSHELRTPLTSIRGALGLLSSGKVGVFDPRAENLIRIAFSNTERLIRLINDLLDLERMKAGSSPLQLRRCSLPDLVGQAIETMGPMADAVSVRLEIAPTAKVILPAIFFDGDPDRILQVLTNLLSNAIKFSPPASTVTIEVETPPDALILKVSDQGRGIPEGQLETVFGRFQQVEHEDALLKGGTGLGLAICRSIVQQHGGSIWALHNTGAGASFCVKLPRLQRTNDTAVSPSLNLPEVVSATSHAENAVLVFDDDIEHRALISGQLRGQGHIVLEAASSQEAIAIAEGRPPQSPLQAILLDLQMSDTRGWETLRALTKAVSTATVPIVVLSVQRSVEAAESNGSHAASQASSSERAFFSDLVRAIDSGDGPSQVLLVEDDQDLAEVVIGGFGTANVVVNHVSTLQRAIEVCRDRRPELMILDLTLPDGDGFSLVEWLRGRSELRSLPLIVYSGREVSPAERSKLLLGPTRFLTKAKVQTNDVEQLVLSMIPNGRVRLGQDTLQNGTGLALKPPSRLTLPNQLRNDEAVRC